MKVKPKAICFIGPSGVGKGTFSVQLQAYLEKYHKISVLRVETGQLLRENPYGVLEPSELTVVADRLQKGLFAPAKIVIKMLDRFLEVMGPNPVVIFDGSPRTKREMRWIWKRFDVLAIILHAKKSSIYKWLLDRGREDDTPELIESRIVEYGKFFGEVGTIMDNTPRIAVATDLEKKATVFMRILPKVLEHLGLPKQKVFVSHKYASNFAGGDRNNAIDASRTATILRAWGYMVFNSLGNSHQWFNQPDHPCVINIPVETYYAEDNEFLKFCDILAVASDFGESKGVQGEIALAKQLGKPVFFVEDIGKG